MKIAGRHISPGAVFYTVFALLLLVSAINLAYIPIAWVDEIGYLDPAVQWVENGKMASTIWNVPGTEKFYAAQLPLLIWVQAAFNALIGTGLFQSRIYELFAVITCILFLHQYLKARYASFHEFLPALLCLLLFTDQAFYESFRSGRMEIIGLAMLASSLYLQQISRYSVLRALLISLLFLTHPAFWPAATVLLFYLFKDIKHNSALILPSILTFILPLFAYLFQAGFDIQLIKNQLFDHGNAHQISHLDGDPLSKHFWFRFCDYYRGTYTFDTYFQLFHPFLNLLCFAWSIHQFLRRKLNSQIIVFLLLATHIFWFIYLAPFKRYTPQLIMLNYIALPLMLQSFKFDRFKYSSGFWKIMSILALGSGLFYFAAINGLAFVQRPYRNSKEALKWLDQNLPDSGSYIIAGEAIAYYEAHAKQQEFYLAGLSDSRNFNSAKKLYYLSYDSIPEKLISSYQPEGSGLSERFREKSQTYYGLKLYELKDIISLRGYAGE